MTGSVRRVATVLTLLVALTACSHASSARSVAAPTTTAPHVQVLAAFGSSAGVASNLPDQLRDSWPQLLFRHSFPLSTVLLNLSDDPTTFDHAISGELPVALQQHVTIAAIWIGPEGEGPCTAATTATKFERTLTALVEPLRDAGARVIVGNVPDGVPCAVAFNAAVTNVAAAQHASIADVASALASTPTVGPASDVTLAESRAIAAAFGATVAGS